MADVFLSYSRRNGDFARRLHSHLVGAKYGVWVDYEDIPLSANWWQEAKRGIEAAYAVVVILTPDSVQSVMCTFEIQYAASLNKRLIPLLVEEFDNDATRHALLQQPINDAAKVILAGRNFEQIVAQAREAISFPNWIIYKDDSAFDQLVAAISVDLEHTREHTRLILRSQDWDNQRRTPGYLIAGEELLAAEKWLQAAVSKEPQPTDLQKTFISESRRVEDAMQRRLENLRRARIGLSVLTVIALIIVVVTGNQVREAQNELDDVGEEVDRQLDRVEALNLAAEATGLFDNGFVSQARDTALLAANLDQETPQIRTAVAEIVLHPSVPLAEIQNEAAVRDVVLDGESVYFVTFEGTIQRWDWQTNTIDVAVTPAELLAVTPALPEDSGIATFDFAAGRFALATTEGAIFVYDQDGPLMLREPVVSFTSASVGISADGSTIAAAVTIPGVNNTEVYLWEADGDQWNVRVEESLDGSDIFRELDAIQDAGTLAAVGDLALSDDGGTLVMGGDIVGFVLRWDWQAAPPEVIPFQGVGDVWSVDVNGDKIAVGSANRRVDLWDSAGVFSQTSLTAHASTVMDVVITPNGHFVISGGHDGDAYIWSTRSTQPLYRLQGAVDWVSALDATDDLIAAGSFDGTVRIWPLRHHAVTDEIFTRDFPTLASAGRYLITDALTNWQTDEDIPHDLEFVTDFIVDPSRDLLIGADSFDLSFVSGVAGSPFTLDAFDAWVDVSGNQADYVPSPTSLTINADATRLILGMDEYIFLWEADDPATLTHLPQLLTMRDMVLSPDGQQVYGILVDSADGSVLVGYDFATDSFEFLLPDAVGIQDFAMSAARDVLVAAGNDRTVYVLDIPTREVRYSLRGHVSTVWNVTISDDGTRALTAGDDQVVRVWDLENGTLIHTLPGHEDVINAAISADGTQAITISSVAIREWRIFDQVSDLVE